MTTTLHRVLTHVMTVSHNGLQAFPGSAISDAVYTLTYSELGELVADLYTFWETDPMHWGPSMPFDFRDYDYCNGYEEFHCTLVEHWCECMDLYDNRGRFHMDKLKAMIQRISCENTNPLP